MRTRNLEKTRSQILQVAFQEVFRYGFQGVSVDDIVKKTTLTKGAFYHHFPTKLALGYALVDDVITPMIIDRWITPLEKFENPIDGILFHLKKNIGSVPRDLLSLGCPLNNLVQEMSPLDLGFKKRLNAALELWISETEKHIRYAQKKNMIKNNVRARDVAQFVVMCHEGFYGMIKGTMPNLNLFKSLIRSLECYFDSIRS